MNKAFGVIYVAFGRVYLAQALFSLQTLRKFNPNLSVCIVTNVPDVEISDINVIVKYFDEPSSHSRFYKTDLYELSPFEKTIFIDADTEVKCDLSICSDLLTEYDLLIRPEPLSIGDLSSEKKPKEKFEILKRYGEFNSGVMLFKKTELVKEFFSRWNSVIVNNNLVKDQKELTHILVNIPDIKFYPLPTSFNYLRNDSKNQKFSLLSKDNCFIWHYIELSYSRAATSYILSRFFSDPKLKKEMKDSKFVYRKIIKPYFYRYFLPVRYLQYWRLRLKMNKRIKYFDS